MRLLFAIFISLIPIGCSKPSRESITTEQDSVKITNQDTVGSKGEFMKLVALLPKVNLPFEVYCEKCCEHLPMSLDEELAEKYLPEGASPVGLIFSNERYTGILVTYPADILVPAVVVYDSTGKKTDEKTFFTACGWDVDYLGLEYFRINADLTLNSTDTSYSFSIDNKTQEIVDTVKTEIVSTDYYINANGKITQK